jgi:hypothetical protein
MNNKISNHIFQIKAIVLVLMLVFCSILSIAQVKSNEKNTVYIDKQGVIRYKADNKELTLFGVNYITPFAYAYRDHKELGVSLEKAIDEDVYHMSRLGLDAFRVHVWDCEISDSLGNIIDNDHLRLLDYQLTKMKERGMKFLITPIAYWAGGHPEPNEKNVGFAVKYGKDNCLINPDAIKAQENYLHQFANHINRYTGIAYKDDPNIIAFEICNEPHHRGNVEETTNFINRLVRAIKNSGCEKPLFYNMSHCIQLADAYLNSNIQGGTFQWYPSGLESGHELHGNFLPNVDLYTIPYADNPKFKKMAKVVYEFDPADIGQSYMYPYMAKSLREAGFQFATQFAYDPLYLAYANNEHMTHYMNLAHAPQKALSLKIAGEAFHKIPIGKKQTAYPNDSIFDVFRVSYLTDLAEMVAPEKFMYTNNTISVPSAPEKLRQIAGYGNSSVVSYEGCGAYFLDRLEDGIWRLEVMPDAVWVRDPFEISNLKKEVSVIIWNKWNMTINLPNLGENFSIAGLNDGTDFHETANLKTINVGPGTYLLTKKGKISTWKAGDRWNNGTLKEFVAPKTSCKKTYLLHQPIVEVSEGKSILVEAKVVSTQSPEAVELFVYSGKAKPELIKMVRIAAYTYRAEIPAEFVTNGFVKYYISTRESGICTTYPSAIKSRPTDRDFFGQNPYQVRVVKPMTPICIFDALADGTSLISGRSGHTSFVLLPTETHGETMVKVSVDRLNSVDPENKSATPKNDLSFKFYFRKKIEGRLSELDAVRRIVLNGNSLTGKPCLIQLALVMDDGSSFAGMMTLQPQKGKFNLSINDLKKVKTVILPNVYPTFLPYYFNGGNKNFDIRRIESIQFSIGPGMSKDEYDVEQSIALESVVLE